MDESTPTPQLLAVIDALAPVEARHGVPPGTGWWGARLLRPVLDDQGLSRCLLLLVAREESQARDACAKYLLSLPWGAHRHATQALIRGLEHWPQEPRETLLRQALVHHQGPPILRLWLWRVLGSSDHQASLDGALEDLIHAQDDAERLLFLEYLSLYLQYLYWTNSTVDYRGAAATLAQLDTRSWGCLSRGYLGRCIAPPLGVEVNRLSSPLERGMMGLIQGWEALRFDFPSGIVPVAILLAAVQPLNLLLNALLGPPHGLGGIALGLFLAWLLVATVTMNGPFSSLKSLKHRLTVALVYFALLAGLLVSAVWVRLG